MCLGFSMATVRPRNTNQGLLLYYWNIYLSCNCIVSLLPFVVSQISISSQYSSGSLSFRSSEGLLLSSVMSDFLTWSALSCFTRTPPKWFQESVLPTKSPPFYSWFGRGMGTVLLDSLLPDDNNVHPVLESLVRQRSPQIPEVNHR